jgi:hypothetical protein
MRVLLPIMFLVFLSGAAQADEKKLHVGETWCRVCVGDHPNERFGPSARQIKYCENMLFGAYQMHQGFARKTRKPLFCAPEEVPGPVLRQAYLDLCRNQADVPLRASESVVKALAKAYPCK